MTMDESVPFAGLLRQARRQAGLTQEALAELAGISTRAISDLERGINRTPRRDTLDMIAGALDLTDEDRRAWERARSHLAVRHAPVRGQDSPAIQLPTPMTSLVGREQEIKHVVDLLGQPNTRLLTLTGPGGVGKTRLSLAAAEQISHEYSDGVWFVDLAPLNDSGLVMPTIAATLGLVVSANRPVLAALTDTLRHSHSLVLLDNVEHVIDAALQIGELVRACPRLTILATSRTPLHVSGEHEYPVPPMDLDGEETAIEAEDRHPEAVALFVRRAQEVRPDFVVAEDNAQAVLAICRRLDGIPLAIELAAVHVRLLSPRAMLRRMDTSLPLLIGGARDLPLRQQTLRNTIAWSYDLLPSETQQLFQLLSVFRGGWTLESAAVVTGDEQVMEGLEQLVEHNLVRVGEEPDGEPRYRMLETIREFGLQQLAAGDQEDHAHAQHGGYFLSLAEDAIPHWRTFEQAHWYGRLETEIDNLRAAYSWFMDHDVDSACQFSGALWRFFTALGDTREGRKWLVAALDRSTDLSGPIRARVLEGIGTMAYLMSDYPVVRECLEEALPLWEEAADLKGMAWSYHGFGRVAYETGDYMLAETHYQKSLEISLQAEDPIGIADMFNVLGVVACAMGEDERARAMYQKSLGIRRKAGDQFGIQQTLSNLGAIEMRAGNYTEARLLFEESLAVGRKHHIQSIVETHELLHLGMLAILEGDCERAARSLAESIRMFHRQGADRWVVICLMSFAELAVLLNQSTRAASIAGAIGLIMEQRNIDISLLERESYDRAIAEAQEQNEADEWISAWARGRVMSVDEVVEYVLCDDEAVR